MEKTLAEVTLKSTEPMRIVRTTAPEPAWTDRIMPFLHHKGETWLEPMRKAYNEGLDRLEMHNYMGLLDSGDIVGNINTFEHQGVGILAHVFTPDHQRRKGICTHIIHALRDDFVSRGGRAMFLGTGHDTPPYHIYETVGFRGRGDSGKMTWLVDETFDESYFALDDVVTTSVRDTRWEDWPKLEALYAVAGQWQLKSCYLQLMGHTGFEGPYLTMRKEMQAGTIGDVKVMQTDSGAIVGHAMLATQPLWKGRALVLELMVHANFYPIATDLISAMTIPVGVKVQAFCDERASDKMAALEHAGFEKEGFFAAQAEDEDHRPMGVAVYGRVG